MPNNSDRANWAAPSVAHYAKETCIEREDAVVQAGDCINSILHWCDANYADPWAALRMAISNYASERVDEDHGGFAVDITLNGSDPIKAIIAERKLYG